MTKQAPARGFSLVEMVVVLGIIVVITSVALLGQRSFDRSLVLTDTAYTLAFSIREAQSLALSGRRTASSVQDAGYGIFIEQASPITSYTLFADVHPATPQVHNIAYCPGHTTTREPEAKPGNCLYTDMTSERVRTYSINRGFTISRFCGTVGSNRYCSSDSASPLTAMHLSYVRGITDSVILGIRSGNPLALDSATIYVAAPGGQSERCVSVSKVGQVSVIMKGEPGCP